MASVDQSLDDFIQKNRAKFSTRGRGGLKRIGGNTSANARTNFKPTQNVNRQGGIQPRRGGGRGGSNAPKVIGDARNKIIQKNRLKLTDARDRLGELAKKTDARLKLQKLRETRGGRGAIMRDYGNNGIKALTTNKRGLHVGRGRPPMPAPPQLQRTISQPPPAANWYHQKLQPLMDIDLQEEDMLPGRGLLRTVKNDQMRIQPLIRPSKLSNPSPYSWTAPLRPTHPSSRNYVDLDYPPEPRKHMKMPSPPPIMRAIEVSDDEEMIEHIRVPSRPSRAIGSSALGSGSRMSMDMKSRLDPTPRVPQPSSQSAASAGYRIVVSNLQASVTHEDIRELFEDVGSLLTSRLVRPGTAEVVYRKYADAVRAVENYHNRQLDGQPMKCLLVKPRPPTAPPSHSSSSLNQSTGASVKMPSSGKSSVVPDISTIHRALFNKS